MYLEINRGDGILTEINNNYLLNDGSTLPYIGLGTIGIQGDQGTFELLNALNIGYRLMIPQQTIIMRGSLARLSVDQNFLEKISKSVRNCQDRLMNMIKPSS